MKTYEQESNRFFEEYCDMIDEYNNVTNGDLEDELENLYNKILERKPRTSPKSFFHEVRNAISATQGHYDEVDIISYINLTIDNGDTHHSLLQNYFDDVKVEYERLSDASKLEFCEENRDAILKSNLKLVISIAKGYRNNGLSLEDLIGAGNIGLCTAWEKYKPEKNVLRDKALRELEDSPDQLTKDYIDSIMNPLVRYGELKERYDSYFDRFDRVYDKKDVIKWLNKNIKKAKFSSVASFWIDSAIRQALTSTSRIVTKPQSEIMKDKEETGSYSKEVIVPIDPLSDVDDKGNIQSRVELSVDDGSDSIDDYQNMVEFKIKLNSLLEGVNNRDRRILFKSFGIGLPRSMEPKEIAESENLSVARVSQVIQDCISKMKKNAKNKNINDLAKYLK